MVLALGSFEFMLVPMQIDLGLSVDQANATNLIPTAASLLVVFAASSLSDRWGYRRLLISGALVYAIGALLVSLAQGFGMVMVGRALGGAGAVTLGIVGLAAINTSFESPDQRAKAFAAFAALIPAVSTGTSVKVYGARPKPSRPDGPCRLRAGCGCSSLSRKRQHRGLSGSPQACKAPKNLGLCGVIGVIHMIE
jgi:hypothetical protein